MERLEGIVEQMESDKTPLEELLVRYEEGIELVQHCTRKLDDAAKRIEIVTKNASGKAKVEEFRPAKSPTPPRAASEPEDVSLF